MISILLIFCTASAKSLIDKLAAIKPEMQLLLVNDGQLLETISDFINRIPPNLNEDQVLERVAEVIARNGDSKNYSRLYYELEKEIILHKQRFAVSNDWDAHSKARSVHPANTISAVVLEDFQMNQNAGSCNQLSPVIAMAGDGSIFSAWVDYRNIDADIYARRFDSNGNPKGPGVLVNDDDGNSSQTNPCLAIDAVGNIVIAWEDNRNGNPDIYAQRFDSNGSPQGSNQKISDDGGTSAQRSPAIDMNASGSFVIAWRDDRNDAGDIYARPYSSTGSALGSSVWANQDAATEKQDAPDVGIDSQGNFTVCWQNLGSSRGIYARQFQQTGSPLAASFVIDSDICSEPSICVDPSNNFAVAWIENSELYGRWYPFQGTPSPAFLIYGGFQYYEFKSCHAPDLAIAASGDILVTWNVQYILRDMKSGWIYWARLTASGQLKGQPILTVQNEWMLNPAIAAAEGTNSRVAIAWQDDRAGEYDYNIYMQLYGTNDSPFGSTTQVNDDVGSSNQVSPLIGGYGAGDLLAAWKDQRSGDEALYARRFDAAGQPNGADFMLTLSGPDTSLGAHCLAVDAPGNFVTSWFESGWEGIQSWQAVNATLFDENNQIVHDFQVIANTPSMTSVGESAVACDGSGNFVIAWHDNLTNPQVKARRFDSFGNPSGDVISIHSGSAETFGDPAIAVSADGAFVVTWEAWSELFGFDIYMRYFDTNNTPLTAALKVNDDIGSEAQIRSGAAMDGEHRFIIVWEDHRDGDANIYMQRYASDGAATDVNQLVIDDGTQSAQYAPTISIAPNGFFAIAWEDYRNGDADIYAQWYRIDGNRRGSNYRVNNDQGTAAQLYPQVDIYLDQAFFAWQDGRNPGQGWDVYARVETLGASNRTIHVPLEYGTIQGAIDAAVDGDTILVAAGTYNISSRILNDHVNNLLLLGSRKADGSNASIIQATINPGTYDAVRFENVSGCQISGFEIRNAFSGIVLGNCQNCLVTQNYVHHNDEAGSFHGSGIYLYTCSDIDVTYCIADSNEYHGIDFNNSQNVRILNNTILRTTRYDGLFIGANSNHITIKNNIFAFNFQEGIEIAGSPSIISHDYNCFWQNGAEGSIKGQSIGPHSFEAEPLLVDINHFNYYLKAASPCLGTGENGTDIGALGLVKTPYLSVDPAILDFGKTESTLAFQITNVGSGSLNWSVIENPDKPWITQIEPSLGAGDALVTVAVDRDHLVGENETGSLKVASNGGIEYVTLHISKTVDILPPHWEVTGETGNNATVILPVTANPNIDGDPLEKGDYIGVFSPNGLCCGVAQWQDQNRSIIAWGDNDQTPITDGFADGERIYYRLYRASTQQEWISITVSYSTGSGNYAPNGYMILNTFDVFETKTITLNLPQGWNMFSINVNPLDPAIANLMAPVANDLVIVKNDKGQNYIPAYGIDEIGDLDFKQGYQAYLKQSVSLPVTGQPIHPIPAIPLPAGWSMISYLPEKPIDATLALASIEKYLVIVKDNRGLSYIPQYGINTIGMMQPGQGYQVYLTANANLKYPASLLLMAKDVMKTRPFQTNDNQAQPTHFKSAQNTGRNATIVIGKQINHIDTNARLLEIGDEIGVFNSKGLCCGASVWQGSDLALCVWGDDAQTDSIDGLLEGENLNFRIWKRGTASEYEASARLSKQNYPRYEANGFLVLSAFEADMAPLGENTSEPALPSTFRLLQNYPNPFNPVTTIEYHLPEPALVNLSIYDISGAEVMQLEGVLKKAGCHQVNWDARNKSGWRVPSGVYFCCIKIQPENSQQKIFSETRKMLLVK